MAITAAPGANLSYSMQKTVEEKRSYWKRKGFYIMTEPYFTFAYRNRVAWWWKVFDIKHTHHEDGKLLDWETQYGYPNEEAALDSAIKHIEELLEKEKQEVK